VTGTGVGRRAGSLGAVVNRLRCFLAVVAVVVLASGCVGSGEPVSWEDQAVEEDGPGLVEREFIAACLAANDDLPTVRAKDFCGCVLGRIQEGTFDEFKGLDDFIDKHRDDVTVAMLDEHYGWFVEATETCAA